MRIYDEIVDHAPERQHVAAEHLHEDLWLSLLREESDDLHKVRLTGVGDGIDGIRFLDPVLGTAHIYQPKFLRELDDDHRAEIVKSFVSAHKHDFPCVRWTLLVPIELSGTELDWLMVGLREEATKTARNLTKAVADCHVDHADGRDLVDLAKRHVSVAALHLPRSAHALAAARAAERENRGALVNEAIDRLRELRTGFIRQRQVTAHRVAANLGLITQGWVEHIGMVGELAAQPGRPDAVIIAENLVYFCERRLRQALHVEGLLPGVSEKVVSILDLGRVLQQAVAAGNAADISELARNLVNEMRKLQDRAQATQRTLLGASLVT